MNYLGQLLKKLNMENVEELYYWEKRKSWQNRFPYRLIQSLDIIRPTAFYCVNNIPLILFFDFSHEKERKIIHKQAWNFNQAPVLFVIKKRDIEIYNSFFFDVKKNKLKSLQNVDDFSYWNLITGYTWKKYYNELNPKNRVDEYLLKNIKDSRKILIDNGLTKKLANNIIGKLLFSRYLIDRNVKLNSFLSDNNANDDFLKIIKNKTKLFHYFEYLKDKFKGDLFPLDDKELKLIKQKHLDLLHNLFRGTEISSGQNSLFDIYDFSIIPIELISNIYEQFIGEDIQKSNQAFYTPPFLVDYVLNNTIEPFLSKENTTNCVVLDPSCGSGIFLVETLRKIIEKTKELKIEITPQKLRDLVKNNIFGIDKDENAINVSIFSLYITLLDYQEPKDIEKFHFPTLMNKNFFVADFFDEAHKFSIFLSNKKIDFILGNSPWESIKRGNHINYCKKRKIPISNNQIAESFLIRVKDFSSTKTKCVLIVTSKVLYNINSSDFRKYFLNHFLISKIFELSAIRKQIFRKAVGPATILFYRYSFGEKTDNNEVYHISLKPNIFFELFKILTVEKYDLKIVLQKMLKSNDCLWKVLLYGNLLDFYLIKRLRDSNKSLADIIRINNLNFGVGVQIGGGDKNDASFLLEKIFLDTTKNMLKRFYINIKEASKWNNKFVHRPRTSNKIIFQAPYVLIKKGLNNDFQAVAAYSEQDMVFTDSVTAIKGRKEDADILKNITGLLNSDLFTYYLFYTGSSTGVERDQAHNEGERFTFPIKFHKKIGDLTEKIQQLLKQNQVKILNSNEYLTRNLEKDLNDSIYNLYDINDLERDLIDYGLNISIPLYKHKKESFQKVTESQIKKYVGVFIEHFRTIWNGPKDFFQVDIYQNEYLVAINFKIVPNSPTSDINFFKNLEIEKLLSFISSLGVQKITNEFYFQKDIKGFEKNSFYVIKPNEFKNWHKAIARIDLLEFIDSIMKFNVKNI